ncbi:MAG: glycosyltransferase [Pirellulaceae bacterium]
MHVENQRQLEVLFLYTHPRPTPDTIIDHINALTSSSKHEVKKLNIIKELPHGLDLNRFDVIVIHYTLAICLDNHLNKNAVKSLQAAVPLKVVFIQDEYRHVNATVQAMCDLDIGIIFTCVPALEIEKVYPEEKLPGVRKVNVLTGYVNTRVLKLKEPSPLQDRPVDVGYRSRRLPAWLGELGQEKWRIGERFLTDANGYSLCCDISNREEDRIYGAEWDQFLNSCRAVLGVESGSSVFDFTGEIQRRVEAEERSRPEATFEELRDEHFSDLEGRIRLNQISPRCFEAAARGTLMILYEGEYSGRLKPWQHYVPLKKDHSNMEEVVSLLCDDEKAQAIADRALSEVARAPENSYGAFSSLVDRILEEEVGKRPQRSFCVYDQQSFARASARSWKSRLVFFKRYIGWRFPLLRKCWRMVVDGLGMS